ncbi:MAG: hypothetical protein ACP5G2_06260 [Candidatus Bipolaricaulaceae bacterium]
MWVKWAKLAALCSLAAALAVATPGCVADISTAEPVLAFSDLLGDVGGDAEVVVTAAGMERGLGGLAVGTGGGPGLQYDPSQFQVRAVEGLGGFDVLAWAIDNAAGEVRFVAVDPVASPTDGEVVKIVGERLAGEQFPFRVDKGNLQLVDGDGTSLGEDEFAVITGGAPPYYARGRRR